MEPEPYRTGCHFLPLPGPFHDQTVIGLVHTR